jgi:hypothetical protein
MKQEVLQLTGGNNKKDRRQLDFYPTPTDVTIALLNFLDLDPCIIWECACGNGVMANVLKKFGHTVIETDISTGCDFLLTKRKADAIITNPPFKLSHLFIEKAVKDARIVCMLLKSQYWHASKRCDLFNKHIPAYVLPLTWRPDFLEHERLNKKKAAPTMEVAWTVWKRGSTITQYIPLKRPTVIQR